MSLVRLRPHLAALVAVVLATASAAAWGRAPAVLRTLTRASTNDTDDIVLALPASAFRAGRGGLTPPAQQELDVASASLADLRGRSLSIVGIGRASVAARRARTVRAYLVSKGLPPGSLRASARTPAGDERPGVVIRVTEGTSREW